VSTMTYVFRVDGMHCGSCALLIDDTLDELPGVSRSQTTVKPGRSTVELDIRQTSPQAVVAAIEELGYRASSLP
jgi:copper chaperone CopZ